MAADYNTNLINSVPIFMNTIPIKRFIQLYDISLINIQLPDELVAPQLAIGGFLFLPVKRKYLFITLNIRIESFSEKISKPHHV